MPTGVYEHNDAAIGKVMKDYIGASRPAPRSRARYDVVGVQTAKSTKNANASSAWCSALRAVSCPVTDESTTFALASAIYVANHRLQQGDYVDFAQLAQNDGNNGAVPRFVSRFTAKIAAIAVVRHAGADTPITLLDTIAMRATSHNVLVDTEQHFVMCFNANEALPIEVKSN